MGRAIVITAYFNPTLFHVFIDRELNNHMADDQTNVSMLVTRSFLFVLKNYFGYTFSIFELRTNETAVTRNDTKFS